MLKDAVVKSLEAQAEAASSEGGAASEAIAKSYKIAANNIKNDVISVQDYFDGLGSTVEEFSSKIDDMQSAWTDLSDVANEYNTYGGLSIDSIQKLLTMSPSICSSLNWRATSLSLIKKRCWQNQGRHSGKGCRARTKRRNQRSGRDSACIGGLS